MHLYGAAETKNNDNEENKRNTMSMKRKADYDASIVGLASTRTYDSNTFYNKTLKPQTIKLLLQLKPRELHY